MCAAPGHQKELNEAGGWRILGRSHPYYER